MSAGAQSCKEDCGEMHFTFVVRVIRGDMMGDMSGFECGRPFEDKWYLRSEGSLWEGSCF